MSREFSDAELVAHVEGHIADALPDLVGKLSREDIRAEVRAKGMEE